MFRFWEQVHLKRFAHGEGVARKVNERQVRLSSVTGTLPRLDSLPKLQGHFAALDSRRACKLPCGRLFPSPLEGGQNRATASPSMTASHRASIARTVITRQCSQQCISLNIRHTSITTPCVVRCLPCGLLNRAVAKKPPSAPQATLG